MNRNAVRHRFISWRKIGTGGGADTQFGIDKGYGRANITAFRFHEVSDGVEDGNELTSCCDHFEDGSLEKEKVFCSGHQVTWECDPGGDGAQLVGINKTKALARGDGKSEDEVGGVRVMSPGAHHLR